MFTNIQGFKEISDNVFVYSNFVEKDNLFNINKELDSLDELRWETHENREMESVDNIVSFRPILQKLNSIILEPFTINQNLSIIRLTKGKSWGAHSDNADFLKIREKSKLLQKGDEFKIVKNIVYGLIIYLNNFEGGELFYTKKQLSYKPNPGDLVIHGAEEDCEHMVNTVLSENRYSYSNCIKELIKIPI